LLPAWLPDLTVRNLHIGKHKLDIHFWRAAECTAFEVIKGDPKLVERCELATKAAQLRTASDLIGSSSSEAGSVGRKRTRSRKTPLS
jgi:hypothetical protein